MSARNEQWFKKAGVSPEVLAELRAACDLPAEYLELLASSNGGEGSLGVQPYRFVLDSAEDAAKNHREKTGNAGFLGFFVFGGDGAGKLLAFDLRGNKPWPVVALDMTNIHSAEGVRKVADDFSIFVTYIGVAAGGA